MLTRGTKRANSDAQDRPPQKRTRREAQSAEQSDEEIEQNPTRPLKRKLNTRRTQIHKYRNIPEGVGGTFTICPEAPFIGTDGCNTCLGVYFAIDDSRCFVAHINIEPQPANGVQVPQTDRKIADYEVSTATERSIVWWVKKQLNDEAWSEDWGPVTQLMRESLVVVCPHSNEEGKTHIGDAALTGVKEFLGIDDDDLQPERVGGFVVRHTGEADMDVSFLVAEQHRWEAVEESVNSVAGGNGNKTEHKGDEANGEKYDEELGLNWAWCRVRHDGRVKDLREGDWEGPYHVGDD